MAPPLPTFLILGAQKSATRWLRHNLGLHPDIFTADHETEFFNHRFLDGATWYRSQFDGWAGEAFVGEATPGYMFHIEDTELIAARIQLLLGTDVRLITILREPVSRTRSAYVHHLRRGRIPPEVDPLEYLDGLDPETDPLGLVSGGWYARSLAPYVDRFGDGLLVELHDDVARAPREVFARTLRHVGVEENWVPSEIEMVRNSGPARLAKKQPDHPILSIPDEQLHAALSGHFVADIELLEEMIGRPVPWPGRSHQGGPTT